MKKLGLFVCTIAALAVSFTACEKNTPTNPDLDNVVSDGMYVIGEAVGVTDINTAANLLMCQGVNEKLMDVDKKSFEEAQRVGMYEKYLYLESGKDFSLVFLDGDAQTIYGGTLVEKDITTDLGTVSGYWCALEENVKMQVPATGFYHVVLDLNKNNNDLDGAGGAQIIIAPVSWGISGDMNGWGMTLGTKAGDNNTTTWTWSNVEIAAGSTFKFKDEKGWKIWLDGETQQVSAHSNLGADMKQGGDNIAVAEGGVYDIVLTWKLAKGAMANSYSYELKKKGDLTLNPATFVVGISGTMNGWADPSGLTLAKYDAAASNVTDAVTKAGTYVFNLSGVTFAAGAEFKFRSNGAWLGLADVTATGVTLSEANNNITGVEGAYDIKITIVWDGAKMTSFQADFTVGTPSEVVYKDITVTGIVPAGWSKCYIWAWNDTENFTGGVWPGEELTIENGKVSKTFSQVGVPISVIFSNGDGAQTNDLTNISENAEFDIQANLK